MSPFNMTLSDILNRDLNPDPWSEGEKIPWNDPAFSQRMLQEHLSQEHDAASRRSFIIDMHVLWIHQKLLSAPRTPSHINTADLMGPGRRDLRIDQPLLPPLPSSILDLGCGPGLYTQRLARLGHTCLGIDFSPASINHARKIAKEETLNCTYIEEDLRYANFGSAHGLVMFLYGELNVFRPADARSILRKARQALNADGVLLLEVSTFASLERLGKQPPRWRTLPSGLFFDRPHLELYESFWNAGQAVTTVRYYIVDIASGQVARCTFSTQAYTQEQYRLLLSEAGFKDVTFYSSLGETAEPSDLLAITARP